MAHFVVQQIQDMITFSYTENSAWVVNSKVVFMEKDSKEDWMISKKVTSKDVQAKLDIKTNPDYNQKDLSAVTFMTYQRDGLPKLTFSYPDYESQTIDLSDANVKVDLKKKQLDLGTIELKAVSQDFDPSKFDQISPTESNPELIPFGGPKTLSK